MNRQFGSSVFARLLGSVAAFALVVSVAVSCSESNTAPEGASGMVRSDGQLELIYSYPDAVRYGAPEASASVTASPTHLVADVQIANQPAALASSVPLATYSANSIPFAPEAAPTANLGPTNSFAVLPNVPLGFTFNYFGNSYTTINISSSGIVAFGDPSVKDGCCWGWWIARNDQINNVIAIGWSAWNAGAVSKPIKYETRGTAPNRRFVLQYTNIPEDGGGGKLTAQLILFEHSNKIQLHTTQLNATIRRHSITQGIENKLGDEAAGLAGRDSAVFLSIANDGVEFTLNHVNTPPIVTAPANISVGTDAGVCVAKVSVGVPSIQDDAPGSSYVGVRSDGLGLDAVYPKGSTSINWTATDAEGLKSSASQSVLVSDKEKPSIKAPENLSVRVNKGVSFASVNAGAATGADNCGAVEISGARSDNAPVSAGFPIGVTTITWTAKDAAGNSVSAQQTVTVIGNKAPVISPPANLVVGTDPRACLAHVDPGMATATDDIEGTVVVGHRTDGLALNDAYQRGVTIIRWIATDADGLEASAEQSVTVSDKEKPEVHAPANISVGNEPHYAYAYVMAGVPSYSDNCPNVSVSASRSDNHGMGEAFPVGVTTVKWTATDDAGNSSFALQSIEVRDVEAPSLVVPEDFSVNATKPSGANVSFAVSAADNVGVVSISCDHPSGSLFPIGYTHIVCVAKDAAGNQTEKEFGVKVLSADEQVLSLIDYVRSLHLSNGVENPLVNQLRNSLKHDDGQECTKMDDFLHLVDVKKANIPPSSVSYMNSEAGRIERVLGCANAPQAPSESLAGPSYSRSGKAALPGRPVRQ